MALSGPTLPCRSQIRHTKYVLDGTLVVFGVRSPEATSPFGWRCGRRDSSGPSAIDHVVPPRRTRDRERRIVT